METTVNDVASLITQALRLMDQTEERAARIALGPVLKAFWTAHSDFSTKSGDQADQNARESRGKFDRRWGRRVEPGPLSQALRACLGLTRPQLTTLLKRIKPLSPEADAAIPKAS